MKIVIAGSSGLIGKALCERMKRDRREVVRLVRRKPGAAKERRWDPMSNEFNPKTLDGAGAVINLAGASVAQKWGKKQKALIRESRIKTTTLLAEAIAGMSSPPVFINASAIGYYGDRGDEICDERSAPGEGFLPELCSEWEDAAMKAASSTRVICLRLGVVLSREGGALKKMLRPFSLCLGGKLGSGKQYMSWVSIDDACGAICHALTSTQLHGPVNVVSPMPVTNAVFTETLGKTLGRPTIFPLPGVIVKMLYGQMGQELLLSSTLAAPDALTNSGYRFAHPDLRPALKSLLRR